jgi:hypothetical protein
MEDDWKPQFQKSRLPFEMLLNLMLGGVKISAAASINAMTLFS